MVAEIGYKAKSGNAKRQSADMKKILFFLLAALPLVTLQAQEIVCGPYNFPSNRIQDTLGIKNWPEASDTFVISVNYPKEQPKKADYPWDKIDFTRKPEDWSKAVLAYCLEGNVEADFRLNKNEVRPWYHVPNLTHGRMGRDFLHGLIPARTSLPKELHPNQTRKVRNFSVEFYNDLGGFTVGQVYCNPSNPDEAAAVFPEGTVFFRLVFTAADTSLVPYLKNTLTWQAFVNANISDPAGNRTTTALNLAQIDVAVKTVSEKSPTGWVMATYVYNGNLDGETWKDRIMTSGVQWGNDPYVTDSSFITGKKRPEQGWVNPAVMNSAEPENSILQSLGWGGRVRGLTDDARTSLLSSQMPVGWPPVENMIAPGDISQDSMLFWFRNVPFDKNFASGSRPVDMAYELALGIRNFNVSIGRKDFPVIWKGSVEDFKEISGEDEEEKKIVLDVEPELGMVGRKMYVFIGFIVLTVLFAGLLIFNLMRKPNKAASRKNNDEF